jgi:hypothetical protein
LIASQRHVVWVNGEPVGARDLASGDTIEFEGGPVLRFRFDPPVSAAEWSPGEMAPRPPAPAWARARASLRARATKTWRRTRARVLLVLAILIGAITFQSLQTQDLERQLVREQQRVSGLAELLRKLDGQTLRRGDLDALRDELSKGLVDTGARVKALEAGSAAASQVIARSSGSVAFVQGSFGFEDPATKRALPPRRVVRC